MAAPQKLLKSTFRFTRKNGLLLSVGLSAVALIVVISGYVLYYSSRVLPRVSAAGQPVSGLTLPETVDRLGSFSETLAQKKIVVKTVDQPDKLLEIHPSDFGLIIDTKATANGAYRYGRRVDFWSSVNDYGQALVHDTKLNFVLTYNAEKLQNLVASHAAEVDTPEINAGVKIEDGKVVETQGINGKRIDQSVLTSRIIDRWQTGSVVDVMVERHDVVPQIATGKTSAVVVEATALRKVKIVLTSDSDPISPKQATFDSWITSELQHGALQAAVSLDAVKTWLTKVALSINADPREAKLAMSDGKVTIFQPGKDGKSLDVDKTAASVVDAVRQYVETSSTDKQLSIPVTIAITKPAVTDASLTTLGITELIGSASTSFVGSPENRKHNIAVGVAALNGILVKSGEEFSTLRYLGKIDGASGYLPELVIKVDKTEPEFGGGLCQVSTTLFRAAMASGLKITERRNHRYRVAYYEPAGKDATIFEGSPDFKFVNDTASNILVQSHIEGTKITFDFYGKTDGRIASQTDSVLTNSVSPPDPEYIQTDTLPEGTTKQTEKAHNGADASFTYTVLNADGSVRTKQTFTSHYAPWQARFLVGTKKVDDQPAP